MQCLLVLTPLSSSPARTNTLSSVSWPLHVVGTFQQADFEAVEADFAKYGNCPFDGIR